MSNDSTEQLADGGVFARVLHIMLCMVIAWVGWWLWNLNRLPNVSIPTPSIPKPNAFDDYVRAGKALIGQDDLWRAAAGLLKDSRYATVGPSDTIHLPSIPSGATYQLKPDSKGGGYFVEMPYALSDKRELVRKNTEALRMLQEAFRHRYYVPTTGTWFSTGTHAGYRRRLRDLLRLKAEVARAEGKTDDLLRTSLDLMRMGIQMESGAGVSGLLWGEATEQIGRREIWRTLQRINTQQAVMTARALQDISAEQVPFVTSMREEKMTGQRSLMWLFRKRGWRKYWVGEESKWFGDSPHSVTYWLRYVETALINERDAMDTYTRCMDGWIRRVQLPSLLRTPPPREPKGIMGELLITPGDVWWVHSLNNDTQNALLATVMSLRAYRSNRGSYPSSLDELTPLYLKKVSIDPFTAGRKIRYVRTGKAFVLYSVGPDGRDDGGKPIPRPERYSHVRPDSKGDIVAGINTQ